MFCSQYLFDQLLAIARPKHVLFECYYNADIFGLIAACKKRNIQTTDIQHGKQGTHHPMYSHWGKIPPEGYTMLPDFFWNWGEDSKTNIKRWQVENGSKHQPVVGGNLWLMQWKEKDIYAPNSAEKEWIQSLVQYDRVVLFSLQPKVLGTGGSRLCC